VTNLKPELKEKVTELNMGELDRLCLGFTIQDFKSGCITAEKSNKLSYTKAELGCQCETEISVDERNKET
jgi:hypothetical protein